MLVNYSAKALIKSIHAYQQTAKREDVCSYLRNKYAVLRHVLWSIVSGSDISRKAKIHYDLKLPHPIGVVIHRDVVIGPECMIMQLVTIGQLADGAVPVIGAGVYIGAGAKVLGGVRVGDNARIGANAVVLIDVPANSTAVGIPAKIVTSKKRCQNKT